MARAKYRRIWGERTPLEKVAHGLYSNLSKHPDRLYYLYYDPEVGYRYASEGAKTKSIPSDMKRVVGVYEHGITPKAILEDLMWYHKEDRMVC